MVASTCDWFGIKTGLYKQIISHRLIVRTLGTLVLFLWFGLSVTLTLSDRAIIDSRVCQGSTFRDWLRDFFGFIWNSVIEPAAQATFGFILIFSPILPILFRDMLQARKEGWSPPRPQSRAPKWLCLLWIVVRSEWYVPTVVNSRLYQNLILARRALGNHRWYIYLVFVYLDASWAYNVIGSAISASEGYMLSHGQVRPPLSPVDSRIPNEHPSFRYCPCLP